MAMKLKKFEIIYKNIENVGSFDFVPGSAGTLFSSRAINFNF